MDLGSVGPSQPPGTQGYTGEGGIDFSNVLGNPELWSDSVWQHYYTNSKVMKELILGIRKYFHKMADPVAAYHALNFIEL